MQGFPRTDGEYMSVLGAVTDYLVSIHSGVAALATQPQNVVLAEIIAAAIKEHQEGSTKATIVGNSGIAQAYLYC